MNTEQIEYYRKFYEENGYAIIPNVATDSEVAELHKRAEELVENFFEDENALKNASIFTTKDQQVTISLALCCTLHAFRENQTIIF